MVTGKSTSGIRIPSRQGTRATSVYPNQTSVPLPVYLEPSGWLLFIKFLLRARLAGRTLHRLVATVVGGSLGKPSGSRQCNILRGPFGLLVAAAVGGLLRNAFGSRDAAHRRVNSLASNLLSIDVVASFAVSNILQQQFVKLNLLRLWPEESGELAGAYIIIFCWQQMLAK